MPYAAQSDLVALWGQGEVLVSSDWDNSGSLNATNITNALQAASDRMDRYIAVRYTVPLTAVPDDLVRLCCDIAMYMLSQQPGTQTEIKKTRYKEAMDFLHDLASNKATLGPDQNAETAATPATVQFAFLDTIDDANKDRVMTFSRLRQVL